MTLKIHAASRLKVMAAPTKQLYHARKVLDKVGIKVGKAKTDTEQYAVWSITEDQYNDFLNKLEAAYGKAKAKNGAKTWTVPKLSTVIALNRATSAFSLEVVYKEMP